MRRCKQALAEWRKAQKVVRPHPQTHIRASTVDVVTHATRVSTRTKRPSVSYDHRSVVPSGSILRTAVEEASHYAPRCVWESARPATPSGPLTRAPQATLSTRLKRA